VNKGLLATQRGPDLLRPGNQLISLLGRQRFTCLGVRFPDERVEQIAGGAGVPSRQGVLGVSSKISLTLRIKKFLAHLNATY